MEITSRGNSLKQQLACALAFTEDPLPEKKKGVIQDSYQSRNPSEPPSFWPSFGKIPSRPRSKPLSNLKRRIDTEWLPPVTPSKKESRFANSEKKDPQTDSMQRKEKSKKYKPKVVSDGVTSNKSAKSEPVNFASHQIPGISKFLMTQDLNHRNAKGPPTLDPEHQGPSVSTTPEVKPPNHGAPFAHDSKPIIPEAPITPDPPQHKKARITLDLKDDNLEAPIMPGLTCMDSEIYVTPEQKSETTSLSNAADSKTEKLEVSATPNRKPDLKPSNLLGSIQFFVRKKRSLLIREQKSDTTRFSNVAESKTEMLEVPVMPDPKPDPKPSTSPGSIQVFVRKKKSPRINGEKSMTDTEVSLEKSNFGTQLNIHNMAKPVKSVRRRLEFSHGDFTDPVSCEETMGTNPNLDKYSSATNMSCNFVVKPVQLVENGLSLNMEDKIEEVMHGEVGAGLDSSLNRGETEKIKHLIEDIDRVDLMDHLMYLATRHLRGAKRVRASKSKLDEIVSKMTQLKLSENALIPYQEYKVKYRGIVALDEDSLIEWNNLMVKVDGCSNSASVENPEREEKWRKERDTFRNLAECFIAKMKLIQGDRHFSKWKGSVVDSVVGAFLTQNVSDQLSSSAFISLCARYPRQQDGKETWPENKFSDFEWTKSRVVDEPTSAADIVGAQIESRSLQVPEDKTPKELTKELSGSPKTKKASVPAKEGYKIGMEHIDWDTLRKEAPSHGYTREESVKRSDVANWDAVRQADTRDVAKAIHGRGQDNVLAKRIQDFLNRVARDHGSVDLEWLREIPGNEAKDYLLSIYGLGLKSVECVRLLALQQVAFPVDTNVGRICVRLGWVPLQPLPESVQMHLLEMYPVMDSIQKYLWPRLCKLPQEILYELHYQMITFGKVFCTKSKPNCNACPLRSDCKHFASAFASAKLMLPEPQDVEESKVVIWNGSPTSFQNSSKSFSNPSDVLTAQFVGQPHSSNCEPIIEEPMTPEEEQTVELPDIEDLCFDDPDEIPTINLNMESFVRNIEELVREKDSELQIEDISKALVLLPPTATSIPPPRLKHSRRLRTVHDAYEIPDEHPILRWLEFEERDPADPSPYLLVLYSQEKEIVNDNLCRCTSCNKDKSCDFLSEEEESKYVKCSIMIPCRTAMRGSFPLNGTYFQVNEVFADHATARNPVMVSREEIWRFRRCSVYVGTTVTTILKGLSTEEVQYCFWRGFVCVREFDRVTRYPKPLSPWLHIIPSMRKKLQQTKG